MDYVKNIDKLPKEHPFHGREKEFVKLMNDDLTKDIESQRVECCGAFWDANKIDTCPRCKELEKGK